MTNNILQLFIEKGFLLDKDVLEFLNALDDGKVAGEILDKIAVVSQKKMITRQLIDENIEKIKPILFELDSEKKKLVDKYFINVNISVEVKKERFIDDLKIEDIQKNSFEDNKSRGSVKIISSSIGACKRIEVKDFVKHFRNRYLSLKKILQERPELDSLMSIDKISGGRNFSIIGIVSNKTVTKNGNIILEVEDLTGKAKLLISQNKEEVFAKSKEILLDDVIGFKCSGDSNFLFVNDFFYPDCFLKEKKRLSQEVYALFISDIHVGSNKFLANNFSKFIDWLNGVGCDAKQKEMLKKIRYLFVVGDTIDGVGVYPGQEKELAIKDIKKQYELLAAYYKKIPSYISIIQCAGQHDAVRVAEPQPPVGEDFGACLHEIDNLYLVSNPSFVEIGGGESEGFKILLYHGASMHGVISEIEELRLGKAHAHPAQVIKHLLLRRHLGPTHGITTYIPNSVADPLVIEHVPDIITTGDLHRTDIDVYNNVLIIANSCWQSITAFEEKVGNEPDPCKVPVLNLKTRALKILDFSDEQEDEPEDKILYGS